MEPIGCVQQPCPLAAAGTDCVDAIISHQNRAATGREQRDDRAPNPRRRNGGCIDRRVNPVIKGRSHGDRHAERLSKPADIILGCDPPDIDQHRVHRFGPCLGQCLGTIECRAVEMSPDQEREVVT